MPKLIHKGQKKLTFKNDEFDDYRSAGEDSDDCTYRPNALGKKVAAVGRGKKLKIDKKAEQLRYE